MQNMILAILAASLIVGSTVQFAAAAERHAGQLHRAHLPASLQYRNCDCSPAVSEEQQYWIDREAGHVISAPAGRS